MPNSRSLPTLDYVSIVASLYKDKRAMLVGMGATVIAVMLAAVKTGAPVLFALAVVFVVSTGFRYFNVLSFERNRPAADDREAAQYWEKRQMVHSTWTAVLYGMWCFVTLIFVRDPFAELVAISVSVAAMIGVCTRTFGIGRIVTAQMIGISTPIALGLVLGGDIFHMTLATLLVPLIVSFRFLAADVRDMLLTAVHERVASDRLAEQLDTALETMQHGLCMLDENGVIALANVQSRQTFAGVAEGSWVGRTFADLLDEAIARRALPRQTAERLNRMIASRAGGKIVMKLSGDYHCEVTVSSRGNRTVLLFENVTARIRAQERINFMARYDGLTGLPNRAHFAELVDVDLASRQRTPGTVLLAILDLDDFKHVNDTLGHLAGDAVLTEVALRIQTVMNRQSRIGRFGGDEFVLYRSEAVDEASARAEAAAIIKALSRPFVVNGERLDMRASIGFVVRAADGLALDDLISRADLALYNAKAQGKGRIQTFEDSMDADYRYRQRLKADLADAIAQNQLSLVYQPQIDLSTRRIAGCEALARWTHPELGPIRPDIFIGLAEEVGLVSAITRWVLRTAADECAQWVEPVTVSVNVSGRDLRGEGLRRDIEDALASSGLEPSRLEIEVTETALIEERSVAASRLKALAERGIGIALDDFGTGYSSLSYLNEMPFSKLKIDRSFLADIETNPRSLGLMANVARLGRDLELVVTAEGVETEEQLALIARHTEVDQIQGFLFGLPLPAAEIRELIEKMSKTGAPMSGQNWKKPVLVAR
ncbi:putative bifunctional diguanylate cyclase/phosphodiesterase [Pelagibacterium lacus]|uniref:EAL domain-containing protein n=1 Tax=Pelagibacterium lacus TaxID=2282655 RepID=A0A369W8I7_9HYPH|nr:EAL domain-containing protein [Pelagibacterium lacus]RDE09670.1 EAL domain-containing protein [Pelagibacterium lacus]